VLGHRINGQSDQFCHLALLLLLLLLPFFLDLTDDDLI
jgi:hypothetical protein